MNLVDDLMTADRIVERVKRGVPRERELSSEETRALIRAFVAMRNAAFLLASEAEQ